MKFTNRFNLPDTIFQAIVNDSYDFKPSQDAISVTALIDSPKIRQLRLKHADEIEEDVSECLWRLLGQAVHTVLERADSVEQLREERLFEDVDEMKVSGKFDVYDGTSKKVCDYKVTSVWSVVYNPAGKREWIAQANIYAWLLRRAGFEVRGLEIHAILRDWSKRDALKGGNYPHIPFVVIPLEMWSDDRTTDYIRQRAELHRLCNSLDPDEFECTPEERWADPERFAVYSKTKTGTWKSRADRVFDTLEEAELYCTQEMKIERRPGCDRRCAEYCNVSEFCNYWQNKTIQEETNGEN